MAVNSETAGLYFHFISSFWIARDGISDSNFMVIPWFLKEKSDG